MANIYSDMGRFLQESFSINDTFKKSARKHLNESRDYPSEWLTDADMFDDGQTIVAKKNIPYDDIDSVQEILDEDKINKIFKIKDGMAIIPKGTVAKLVMLNGPSGGWPEIEINGVQILFAGDLKPWFANIQVSESLKEDYETDVDLPYDPDAPYNVYADTQSDPDAPYNVDMDSSYELDPDAPYNVNESFSDARPAATKIFNFIEMGADPADILDELLRFLPDGALVDFADYYGENFLGIGDDWE